jgi:TPR repeat protein
MQFLKQLKKPDALVMHEMGKDAESQGPQYFQDALDYYEKAGAMKHVPSLVAIGDLNLRTIAGDSAQVEFDKYGFKNPQATQRALYLDLNSLPLEEQTQKLKTAALAYGKAAKLGDIEAKFQFALMQLKGLGMPKNEKQALKTIRQLSKTNNNAAMTRFDYTRNADVSQAEQDEALKYLVKAGNRGTPSFKLRVGDVYRNILNDENTARQWYGKAEKQRALDLSRVRTQLQWMASAAYKGHLSSKVLKDIV